jgi:hypothetical protein
MVPLPSTETGLYLDRCLCTFLRYSAGTLREEVVETVHLANQVHVRLPEDFIQREATYGFLDEMNNWEIKHLLMGGDRFPSVALN